MYTSGSSIADRYRLDARLASGGMGDVWSAYDTTLGRPLAIKLVKPEYADDPSFRARLVAEARATAAVSDPHVVEIFDVGDTVNDEGRRGSYIAMALVAGAPVSELLRSGALTPTESADLMTQVAAALAASHARGVIHRDIKPANLMRDENGSVTVLDFGIARAADAAALTATGQLLGTARYMSPEQVSGQPATTASDVYALGVVAYQCLAGTLPFDAGSDVATALAHRDEPVPPLPATIPHGLAALVEACLSKDPAARPSASEAAAVAASYVTASGAASSPTTVMAIPAAAPERQSESGQSLPQWLKGRRAAGIAAAVAGVVAVATLIVITTDGSPPATASGRHHGQHVATHSAGVAVRASHYVGEPYSLAAAQLTGRGLTPIASGGAVSPAALVTSVSPTGSVKPGTSVTLSLSGPAAPAATPPGPAKTPPGHAKTPPDDAKTPPGQAKKDGWDGLHGDGGH